MNEESWLLEAQSSSKLLRCCMLVKLAILLFEMSRTRRRRTFSRPDIELNELWEMYSSVRNGSEERPVICEMRLDWRDKILRLLSVERF